jgi:hypothetical protein
MKLAASWKGDLTDLLDEHRNQPDLTRKLDDVAHKEFDQSLINEIVLWKVNRYALLSPVTLTALNQLVSLKEGKHKEAESTLIALLRERGVDLPTASTFLRFRNPKVFQIIDRRAYRALYGEDYPLHGESSIDKKVGTYFKYLDRLVVFAKDKRVDFEILDRVLYVFDKKFNGRL